MHTLICYPILAPFPSCAIRSSTQASLKVSTFVLMGDSGDGESHLVHVCKVGGLASVIRSTRHAGL